MRGDLASKRDWFLLFRLDQTGPRNRWDGYDDLYATHEEAAQRHKHLTVLALDLVRNTPEDALYRVPRTTYRVEQVSKLLATKEGRGLLRKIGLDPARFAR